MKFHLGDPVNTVAVQFDELKGIAAGLLEIEDKPCRDLIVHFFAFHHQPVAVVAVRGAQQDELGKVPCCKLRVEIVVARVQAFGYFCLATVILADVLEEVYDLGFDFWQIG